MTKLTRRTFLQTSGVAAAGLTLAPNSLEAKENKPNHKQPHIIFIMTDQHRGDAIGLLNPVVQTPNIDKIGQNGLIFRSGYSSTPSCTPARSGLLTGQSPWNHGMLGYSRVARKYPIEMPRMLGELGYYTFGIGKMHWYPQKSLHGFHGTLVDESGRIEDDGYVSDYRDWFRLNAPGFDPDKTGIGWNENKADTYKLPKKLHPTEWTGNTAVQFIENYEIENPLFLKVSFARPHSPYDPPKEYLDKYHISDIEPPVRADWSEKFAPLRNKENYSTAFGDFGDDYAKNSKLHYYANISFIDDQVGKIIEALKEKGIYDDCIICFTSDHGDMMGDHNHWRKTYAYEPSAKIPFLMQYPNWMEGAMPRGSECFKPVELRDFLPTFLEAAGGKIPKEIDGKSLLSFVHDKEPKWREYIDLEHATCYSASNYWAALTDGKMKYIWFIHTGEEQLFDIEKDPKEIKELSSKRRYQKELKKWRQRMVEHLEVRGETFVKDKKLVKRKNTLLIGPNFPDKKWSNNEALAYWRKETKNAFKMI
ncbi:arylsulfatase [Halosquirtibacter laminarini]|uniref:Arylsulfatase n=1 Tax=Halosquirtibacter laminarini TaxID=3374600 RepID=A0AC61NJN9_9BACT|nr:arylsulfatase [Prolixibacteraceae bacterium]